MQQESTAQQDNTTAVIAWIQSQLNWLRSLAQNNYTALQQIQQLQQQITAMANQLELEKQKTLQAQQRTVMVLGIVTAVCGVAIMAAAVDRLLRR